MGRNYEIESSFGGGEDDARRAIIDMGVDPTALDAYLAAPLGGEDATLKFVQSLMETDFLGLKREVTIDPPTDLSIEGF